MDRRIFISMALSGAAWLAGCTGAGQTGFAGLSGRGPSAGVLEVAQAQGATAFLRAVRTAGLEEELSGSGPYTLFAPTDAAFRAAGISPGGDGDALRRLIGYHVVPGQVGTSFMRGMEMKHLTSAGETLSIDGRENAIRVNGARILREDIGASNGVVHVVDQVLRAG
jgi:uncharacterized surface protein with fasciclin (FAS1) repeats